MFDVGAFLDGTRVQGCSTALTTRSSRRIAGATI